MSAAHFAVLVGTFATVGIVGLLSLAIGKDPQVPMMATTGVIIALLGVSLEMTR